MNFIETRGNDGVKDKEVTFSYAIKNPSASFGGLYVPKNLPVLDENFIEENINSSYKELTLKILKMFEIDIDEKILKDAVDLYDNFDDKDDPVPLKKVEENLFVSELYHGPTRAFKDVALQPFGHLLSSLAEQEDKRYLILAATSGDTGPATLDTFANKKNIKVVCLYPEGRTSDVQKLQMVTEHGNNLKVIGINGDFDDTQHALKSLLASNSFKDELTRDNLNLSAANSVNFGRIIFQIIYHIGAYIKLVADKEIKNADEIYSIVPSGNFGDALGAYYAKKMGINIKKILIASNTNNILTDLIKKGEYDLRKRELINTTSPAMDILISSNVERVLFDKFGSKRCKEMMDSLNENRYYKLNKEELESLREDFVGCFSDDEEVKKYIKDYAKKDYIMDPHTATCIKAYENVKNEDIKSVACSTAEWTKFAPAMMNALKKDTKKYSDLEALDGVSSLARLNIPEVVSNLFKKDILHKTVIEKEDIEKEIIKFIRD